jgi:CheY-like chemotaxis protein
MKNVFLAEDDADDREFFEDALKEVSIKTELTISVDGAELMNSLDEIVGPPPPPHIIFLDLNMPRKNGMECLREIRETPRFKNIPIAIFSTTSNEDVIEKTYAMGASCYIRKPNSHKVLIDTIEKVLAIDFWEKDQRLPKEKFVLSA